MKKLTVCLLTLALLMGCLVILPVSAADTVEGYTVEFNALSVVAVYNQTPVSTEVGTKVYIDYTVVSSNCPAWVCFVTAPNPDGIWPFNNAQGGGSCQYFNANQSIIIQPGCTYHVVYEVTGVGEGYNFTCSYTDADGNTHEVVCDSFLSEPTPAAGQEYSRGPYVGITAFNADSSAKLIMKITDENGNDLGLRSNRGETIISAPPLNVTYMVDGTDVTNGFDSSAYSFDPAVGLDKSLLPTYNTEDGTSRVTEWYYDAELTQKCDGIAAGSATKNVTLYGKSVPCTYSIIFNANGGEGSMENQILAMNATANLTPNAFTYEDRTFLGWGYFNDDKTPTFTDGQEVSALANKADASVFLYAIWSEAEVTEPAVEDPTEPADEGTAEVTDAPTEAPTEAPTTPSEEVTTTEELTEPVKSGCGAAMGAASLLMAMAAAVALTKKR